MCMFEFSQSQPIPSGKKITLFLLIPLSTLLLLLPLPVPAAEDHKIFTEFTESSKFT